MHPQGLLIRSFILSTLDWHCIGNPSLHWRSSLIQGINDNALEILPNFHANVDCLINPRCLRSLIFRKPCPLGLWYIVFVPKTPLLYPKVIIHLSFNIFSFLHSFFLERNMLSFFLKIMNQKCGSYVCVQLLQTLNILFENIRNETSICK